MIEIRTFTTADAPAGLLEGSVQPMLVRAFDGDFDDHDWAHALGGTHVVALDGEEVVGHAAVVARILESGGRPWPTGYVEAVATEPARHGQGIGRVLMGEVEAHIRATYDLGGLCTGTWGFYERLGWERIAGPTWVRRRPRPADDPRPDLGPVRTAEADDAVMLLRFGPSAALDLAAPLSCDPRPGDVW